MKRGKILYCMLCLLAVIGLAVSCQKYTYDFTYSPSAPKAGEKVTFTNISEAGENWVWTFGDGGKSTLKNPTHIYTAAGTYVVELMADSNRNRKISHVLEVLDSIPSIYLAAEEVAQYTPVTLKASFYNPTKATVTYEWTLDESIFVITQGSLTSDSIIGYYTDFGRTTEVSLSLTIAGKTTVSSRTITLTDNEAPFILMQTADGTIWRQRIYNGTYEDARLYDGDASALQEANDSTATLNGVTYDIHSMPVLTDKQISALQVDGINRKLYLILADGVYVANANGDALTRITESLAYTLLIDGERNSIYWTTDDGVYAMPLVNNPQNIISEQILNKIKRVNTVAQVERMVTSR